MGGPGSRAAEAALSAALRPLLLLREFPRSLCQLVVQSLSPPAAQYPTSDPFGAPSAQNGWPAASVGDEDVDADMGDGTKGDGNASPQAGSSFAGRAAGINAAALAALHAGSVGLRAVPLAVALALTPAGELLVDPSQSEEADARARFAFAWAFGAGVAGQKGDEAEIAWVEAEGAFDRDEFDKARDLSRGKAGEVLEFVREQAGKYFE